MAKILSGQTLSGIVKQLGTTPEEFLKSNPGFAGKGGKNDYMGLTGDIQIGQEYNLPGATPASPITPVQGSGTYIEDLTKQLQQKKDLLNQATQAGFTGSENIPVNQAGQIAGTSNAERAKIRKEELDKIKTEMGDGLTAPTPYKSMEEFDKLRKEQGVVKDEEELSSLRNEASLAKQELRQFGATAGEGVSEAGRTGMMSEAERNINFKLEGLAIREGAIIDRLNNKNTYIKTVLDLGKDDYTTALNEYNNAYTKNYQAVTLLNSQASDEQKDAITGLTTMSNLLKDKNIDFSNLDPAIKTQIETLSLKAGLPSGLIEQAMMSAPNDEVKTVNARTDNSGNEFFDILRVKPDGSMYVQSVSRGKGKAPEQTTQNKVSDINNYIDSVKGSDKKIAYESYVEAYNRWQKNGGTLSDFKNKFPAQFLLDEGNLEMLPDYLKPADNNAYGFLNISAPVQ